MEAEPDVTGGSGKPCVLFNVLLCDYEVVAQAGRERGWRNVHSKEKAGQCHVHWIDNGVLREWFPRIEPGMRVNHFPGMHDILGRKGSLARNMARVQRRFPGHGMAFCISPEDVTQKCPSGEHVC